MENKNKISGLDAATVFAVGIILVAQGISLITKNSPVLQIAAFLNFLGPEILIVWFGFVFGRQFLDLFLKNDFNLKSAATFILHWMAIMLPLYFFTLFLNCIITGLLGPEFEDRWKFFALLQNFATPMPDFFPESWIVPVILFAAAVLSVLMALLHRIGRPLNKSKQFVTVVMALILLAFGIRWIFSESLENTNLNFWHKAIRSVVVYRFDSFFIGALCSWVVYESQALSKFKGLFACLGMAGLSFFFAGVGFFHLTIESHQFFWNVLYLPLLSVAVTLLFPIFIQNKSKTITGTSGIAYAAYLLHFGVILELIRNLPFSGVAMFILYMLIASGAAFFSWFVIQKVIIGYLFRRFE